MHIYQNRVVANRCISHLVNKDGHWTVGTPFTCCPPHPQNSPLQLVLVYNFKITSELFRQKQNKDVLPVFVTTARLLH